MDAVPYARTAPCGEILQRPEFRAGYSIARSLTGSSSATCRLETGRLSYEDEIRSGAQDRQRARHEKTVVHRVVVPTVKCASTWAVNRVPRKLPSPSVPSASKLCDDARMSRGETRSMKIWEPTKKNV